MHTYISNSYVYIYLYIDTFLGPSRLKGVEGRSAQAYTRTNKCVRVTVTCPRWHRHDQEGADHAIRCPSQGRPTVARTGCQTVGCTYSPPTLSRYSTLSSQKKKSY